MTQRQAYITGLKTTTHGMLEEVFASLNTPNFDKTKASIQGLRKELDRINNQIKPDD
tara:strand:- start:1170 stop:1340 length:171 start_codon:yes stop_codon:yes gene_type:complete